MEALNALVPDTDFCREHCTNPDGTIGHCALLAALNSTSRVSPVLTNYDALGKMCTLARHELAAENTAD